MSTFGFDSPHHGQAVCWSKQRWFSLILGRSRVQLWYGAVGIATCYGLEGLRIESRWGEIFRTRPDGPGAQSASYIMGTGSFPGVNRSGRGVDYLPPYSAKVKERVELTSSPPLGLRGLFQGQLQRYPFSVLCHETYYPH